MSLKMGYVSIGSVAVCYVFMLSLVPVQLFITDSIRESSEFCRTRSALENVADKINKFLNERSVPFYSVRYMGHMDTDV